MEKKSCKIGALISGTGTNLKAVIAACRENRINGRVVFAGADRPAARGLEMAGNEGLETFVVDYRSIIAHVKTDPDGAAVPADFDMATVKARQQLLPADTDERKLARFLKSRAIAEKRLLDHIRPFGIDLLILAGFMRTLTPYFIDRFHENTTGHRIMNIHPALLPAFPGTDGYGDTFRYGCKVGGCTVHFIDYGEDTGKIIGQKAFEIEDADTLEDVREKGLALEWQLYPECIRKVCDAMIS